MNIPNSAESKNYNNISWCNPYCVKTTLLTSVWYNGHCDSTSNCVNWVVGRVT